MFDSQTGETAHRWLETVPGNWEEFLDQCLSLDNVSRYV